MTYFDFCFRCLVLWVPEGFFILFSNSWWILSVSGEATAKLHQTVKRGIFYARVLEILEEQTSGANLVTPKLGSYWFFYVKVWYLFEHVTYVNLIHKFIAFFLLQRTKHNRHCLPRVSLYPPIPLKFITFNKTATRISWTSLIFTSQELRTLKPYP